MAVLRKAIETLDPTPDKKNDLTLALNLLFELAQKQSKLQKEWIKNHIRTAGSAENPSIPVTNTLGWHSEVRAYVSNDAKNLTKEATSAVKKFVQGGDENIINGAGELVGSLINAVIGSGIGVQHELHTYFIIVSGLAIVRIDVTAWRRTIEASGITKQIENAITISAAQSSIDVDKITFNTFLAAYSVQLQKMALKEHEILKKIQEAKKVYAQLRSPDLGMVKPYMPEDAILKMPTEFTEIDNSDAGL